MKGKYTFNRLLHNNKLMIVFSIAAAIAIWASVVFGSSIPEKGTVKVDVPLDMSSSYPGSKGLKNFSDSSIQVEVDIKGSRAVVKSVEAEPSDIKVTPDFNTIYGAGDYDVSLKCSKSGTSNKTFDIVGSPKPDSVKIYCDYEQTKSVAVNTDISGISVKDSAHTYLGTPIVNGVDNNTVQITGPQSIVSKIASVVAKVDKQDSISEAQNYPATVQAYDNDKNPVDLKYCKLANLDVNSLSVIVPVYSQQTVNLTLDSFDFKNVPTAYKNNSAFYFISPASLQLSGPPSQIDSYVKNLGKIGTIDFCHINPLGSTVKIPLNIPQGIHEKNGVSDVSVALAMQSFTSVSVNMMLNSSNTHFLNTAGRTASVQQMIGVTLVGPVDSVTKVKETDLSASVDLANDGKQGTREVNATIQINNGFTDVWAYYGDSGDGYPISITVQ